MALVGYCEGEMGALPDGGFDHQGDHAGKRKQRGSRWAVGEERSEVRAQFPKNTPPRRAGAAAKDAPYRENQVEEEHRGEGHRNVWVVEDTPEGRSDVVPILQDVFVRVGDPEVPDAGEVAHKRGAVVDRRVLVQVGSTWSWDGGVS